MIYASPGFNIDFVNEASVPHRFGRLHVSFHDKEEGLTRNPFEPPRG